MVPTDRQDEQRDNPTDESPSLTTIGLLLRPVLPIFRLGLICFALWFAVRTVIPSFAIEGESMSPTFHDGGHVVLNGTGYEFVSPDRGDIVVFHPPYDSKKPYIKRVIGLPGDLVEIRDGGVFVNGERLDEEYTGSAITSCFNPIYCKVTVPDGMLYVLGDNRGNSSDSRIFGPIVKDAVVGEVLFSYWPFN